VPTSRPAFQPYIAWYRGGTPPGTGAPATGSADDAGASGRKGNWTDAAALAISVDDIGLRQSAVAVERMRTYGGKPASVSEHVIRWRRTVDYLGISITVDETEIRQRIDELIGRNRNWCQLVGDFGITMLATPGRDGDEQGATEIMHLNALNHARINRHHEIGQPLVITDVQQPPAKSWPRDIKVRCRLHYYLADRATRQLNPDALGLLIDTDGSVTETSVANLAICRSGIVVSPPAEQVLPGVTQQLVQHIAAELGLTWTRQPLFPADVREADEVWLMGTDGGLWFASHVDGVAIGDAGPGEIYRRALAGFYRWCQASMARA
jgi:branched-chain amino acid aminotransferase